MKQLIFLSLALFATANAHHAQAQACGNPKASIDLKANNIQARILNGGDLFTNHSYGQFLPNPNPNSSMNPSTMFAAGLWMGGIDPAGNLRLSTVNYRYTDAHDYSAGPLDPNDGTTNAAICANWDRIFSVKGARVKEFLTALPMSANQAIAQYPEIMGWPGRGNPHFAGIAGFDLPATMTSLAPFFDANGDALYDPLAGDYPAVELRGIPHFVPAQIIWTIFNDNGGPHTTSGGMPLGTEVQLTAWAFDCANDPVLLNTIFTNHKLIYRGDEKLEDVYISIWTDFDVGCSYDDNVGCNPSLSTMFAYNQDLTDGDAGGTCVGTPTFPGVPPVQSITFLNQTLDKFIVNNSFSVGTPPPPTQSGYTAPQAYLNMSGLWLDGSPITQGGNGVGGTTPVSHIFPDNPVSPAGWSMCTVNLPVLDFLATGSVYFDAWNPGAVNELTTAWAVHPNPNLPCGLGSTFADVAAIRAHFNNGFGGVCSPLKAPSLPEGSISVFPNPTDQAAIVKHTNISPLSFRVFDAQGRLVLEKNTGFGTDETAIETAGLATGIYTVQVSATGGVVVKKLAVVR